MRHVECHPSQPDYDTRRNELAALPVIGGSSDIGVQLGAVGQLTHFQDGIRPYRWKATLTLSASFLSAENGVEVAQQNYVAGFDIAGLADDRVRSISQVRYRRAVTLRYFGIGNESSAELPPVTRGDPSRHFESILTEAEARELLRIRLKCDARRERV